MTINSTIRKAGPFIGNGTASSFPFTYKVFQASDLDVVRLDQSTNVETTLVLTTDYTVTLNQDQDSNPGGTVTLVAGALATGYTLTMTSDVPNLQPTDLTNQGGFYPEVINDALDRATIQIQQLQEQTDRSLRLPLSSTADAELPPSAPNELIGWDATGNNLINVDPGSLATVVAYATAYCDVFIGNGITTSWTLTRNPAVLYNLDVSINGSSQEPTRDYTLSGTTFTMTTPPPIGARVVVKYKEGLPNYSGDSQDVRYVPSSASGAVTRSVQTKLREGWITIQDFGGVADGTTDNTPALNAAIAAIQAGLCKTRTIYFPAGGYHFKTRPNDITTSVQIIGENKGATALFRDFSGATDADGLFNFRAGSGSSRVDNLGIVGNTGTTGGCLISMVAGATSAGGDFSRFSNLYLTSAGNTHKYTIYMDGSARSSAPIGIRDVFFDSCSIFGATDAAIYAKSVVALHFNDCDTFPAGGTSGKMIVTGTSSVYSYYVTFSGGTLYGIDFDYTYFSTINVAVIGGNITNTANTNGVVVIAGSIGSVQENWTSSAVYASSNAIATRGKFKSIAAAGEYNSATPLYVGPDGPSGSFSAPSGTGNLYGFYITPTSSGRVYLDALTGNPGNAVWDLRMFNAGTYYRVVTTSFNGEPGFPSHTTTASAANAYLDPTAGWLYRSTSSGQYKTQVETLGDEYADKLLALRPVWYRSLAEADRKDWSWYGLIAEEVAAIEPRLVHWKFDKTVLDETGETKPAEDAQLVPDGVQYERLTVLMLNVIQRQEKRIADLEAKLNGAQQ